jgi:hypothetical protein
MRLTERADRLEAVVEQQAQGLSKEEQTELYDSHTDTWHALKINFPARLYNSFLLTLCAWAEAELTSLCRFTERGAPDGIQLKDISGNGLRRCQTFLKKVSRVDFPDTSADWHRMLVLYEIRNSIAHTEGESTTLSKDAKALLKAHGCLTKDALERVQLNAALCEDAVDCAERFFVRLGTKLPKEMQLWPEDTA